MFLWAQCAAAAIHMVLSCCSVLRPHTHVCLPMHRLCIETLWGHWKKKAHFIHQTVWFCYSSEKRALCGCEILKISIQKNASSERFTSRVIFEAFILHTDAVRRKARISKKSKKGLVCSFTTIHYYISEQIVCKLAKLGVFPPRDHMHPQPSCA